MTLAAHIYGTPGLLWPGKIELRRNQNNAPVLPVRTDRDVEEERAARRFEAWAGNNEEGEEG